ncbi:MAG: hypothetical protein ACRC3Y_14165 [Romboutsia sp.]|uniref:hypothetical protein n=1 Tax=Romboutsia sp. TaxID=1965302 RepID=UPI003F30639B
MNKKGILAVALGLVVLGGGFAYSSNQADSKVASNKQVEGVQGTSEMLKEELVADGAIDSIEVTENGSVIKVADVSILVHMSTNVFKGDDLLEVNDLEKGQNVKVYSDGVQQDILNGLRVEIVK